MDATGTALVTGASRGIGRAVAVELAARGFDVVATMRDPAAGQGLPAEAAARGGDLRVERLDVTEPETMEIPRGLRVLVNNAAFQVAHDAVEDTPMDVWREMFETNVLGVVELTRRAIPALRDSGGGVVCNVTSAAVLMPVPFDGAYRASKAAVSALGESLRVELAPFGIRILEVMPGPIDTDMLAKADRLPGAVESSVAAYSQMATRMNEGRTARLAEFVTAPEVAAGAIADAVLDDGAPLRVGCDPLGARTLETWRSTRDEDRMASMIANWLD